MLRNLEEYQVTCSDGVYWRRPQALTFHWSTTPITLKLFLPVLPAVHLTLVLKAGAQRMWYRFWLQGQRARQSPPLVVL